LLEYVGWVAINQVVFPTVFVAGALLLWLTVRKQQAAVV
jgi:hypothetical protein